MNKNVPMSEKEVFGFFILLPVIVMFIGLVVYVIYSVMTIQGLEKWTIETLVHGVLFVLFAFTLIRLTLFNEKGFLNACWRLKCLMIKSPQSL